jgi:prepilin-type N-terminal cleavage/methylation domain-containing protein
MQRGHLQMLKQLRKNIKGFTQPVGHQQAGFTSIEVLIVLAIAGLILLIVFLAVPALQRNSRNTQYRTEASRLLGSAQEQINNNGGALLTASVSTTAGSDAAKIVALSNLKNITGTFTIEAQAGVSTTSLTTAVLRLGATCTGGVAGANGATTTYSTPAAATRSIALIYSVEDASGNAQAQCTSS